MASTSSGCSRRISKGPPEAVPFNLQTGNNRTRGNAISIVGRRFLCPTRRAIRQSNPEPQARPLLKSPSPCARWTGTPTRWQRKAEKKKRSTTRMRGSSTRFKAPKHDEGRLKHQAAFVCLGRGLLEEEWCENECDCREQFDEDVQRRPGGVLEGIADGVADDGGLVCVGALAAVLSGFDELLGVVPGAAAVVHQHREQDAGNCSNHQQTGHSSRSAEIYRDAVNLWQAVELRGFGSESAE